MRRRFELLSSLLVSLAFVPACLDVTPAGQEATTPRCLEALPTSLRFAADAVGVTATQRLELRACGGQPATIEALAFASDDATGLDLSPNATLPARLAPGETLSVEVSYTPTSGALATAGVIVVSTPGPEPPLEVPVELDAPLSPSPDQPLALFSIAEGEEVPPQTMLHLDASASAAPSGSEIATYRWRVEQPEGSRSVFLPSADAASPVFEANVVGVYRIYLDLVDSDGRPSSTTAMRSVTVSPDTELHIELLWHTPGDPDETDVGPEAGTDLDLHFAAPGAQVPQDLDGDGELDPWFDMVFDTYWYNPAPLWTTPPYPNDGSPHLDRDDTDGAGPENLNLDGAAPGAYRVGVHYWQDRGYGDSWATVRVYYRGALIYEAADMRLSARELWEVGSLELPSGTFTPRLREDGEPMVTPDYWSPYTQH